MNIQIRKGHTTDIDSLEQLYNELNEYLEATTNYPGWKKGVYPLREDAVDGIEDDCLFVATENEQIIGSMILHHESNPKYQKVAWQHLLNEDEVLIVHTFVVAPKSHHQGVAEHLLQYAADYAKKINNRALRLDVYVKNLPAIRLYEKCGFQYIDTISLGLEQYGLDWFRVYEKMV